jgi:DNA-binding transcriptional ArsR family regulator
MVNKKEILNFETRRKIFSYIKNNPGLHLRELSRKLDVPYSTIKYHLNILEKNDLILSKDQNGYQRYYLKDKIGSKYKEIINVLRQDTTRKIILCLLDNTSCTRKELSKELNKSPQTISFHLKKLLELNIIREPKICEEGVDLERERILFLERKPKVYERLYILDNPVDIYYSLINYKDSLDNFPDIEILIEYFTFCFSTVVTQTFPKKKTVIDRFIDDIFELFPIPWCA